MYNWTLDQDFIRQALKVSQSVELVSFDIFDTALTRLVDSPIDVFAQVEEMLIKDFGSTAKGFALARERAEKNARQLHHHKAGLEEVSFAEIYQELPALLSRFDAWPAAMAAELAAEKNCLIAVPDILELTKSLISQGKEYIFVSDMYLPSRFLSETLQACGFQGWKQLYVSNELRLTKSSGRIWNYIKSKENRKILHIGDDHWSDISGPKNHDIQTIEYGRVRSERRVGAKLTPALLPFSRLKRDQVLSAASKLRMQDAKDEWYALGFSLGGLVVGTFIQWLSERVKQHRIDRLYFCARDGYLIKKAWEAAGFSGVETKYLYISRAALNMAAGVYNSSPQRLSSDLLSFLSSSTGKTTIETALARATLQHQQPLVEALKKEFGALSVILNGNTVGRFEALLQAHAVSVYAVLADRYETCLAYLKQEGMFLPGRQAIVDMGWNGSIQLSLSRLLKSKNKANELFGFYYGLWPAATGNRYVAGLMEPCFTSDFLHWQDQQEVQQSVALLEQLHSAPEGSVSAYKKTTQGVIEPVLKSSKHESIQHKEITEHFQRGTLAAIASLFGRDKPHPLLATQDLSKETAIAALGALMLSPSLKELQLLATVGHCATFDHATHEGLIQQGFPFNEEKAAELFFCSEWRLGQLKLWWLLGNAHQKAFCRTLAERHFNFLDGRILNQFY